MGKPTGLPLVHHRFIIGLSHSLTTSSSAVAGIFVDSAVEAANMFRSDAEMIASPGEGRPWPWPWGTVEIRGGCT